MEDDQGNGGTPAPTVRPVGYHKAKAANTLRPQKLELAEATLVLKKEHSEKAIAELRRKNDLLKKMNGIELFRNESSAEATEFLKLKRTQYILSARLKLAETKEQIEKRQ